MKAKTKKKASQVKNTRDSKNKYLSEPAGSRVSRKAMKIKDNGAGREAQW